MTEHMHNWHCVYTTSQTGGLTPKTVEDYHCDDCCATKTEKSFTDYRLKPARRYRYVDSVDDLPADAPDGEMRWVIPPGPGFPDAGAELWVCDGKGNWYHQPLPEPPPPVRIHHARQT